VARKLRRAWHRFLSGARLRAYQGTPPAWVSAVPRRLAARLRLHPPPPGERRLEFGSGWSPRPGYIHVDVLADNPLTDVICRADELDLPAGWADEILSLHMIEHVPPPALAALAAGWLRLLRPGGTLTVHTPNAAAIGAVLADPQQRDDNVWIALSAVYGYNLAPWDAGTPDRLRNPPDHKLVFTPALLTSLLEEAGFVDVADVSGADPACHHTKDWAPYVPGLCLEIRATRP